MNTVCIIAARMGSTRLKGKVLFDLGGQPVLRWVVRAAQEAIGVDQVYVATTTKPEDDAIVGACEKWGVPCWIGPEHNVLKRFADCATHAKADVVIRLTGDCPLMDPHVIDEVIALHRATGAPYVNNVDPPSWPDGLDVQLVTNEALQAAHREATKPSDRDTVIEYISRNRVRWPSATLTCPIPGLHKERWVLDHANDYEFCKAVVSRLRSGVKFLVDRHVSFKKDFDGTWIENTYARLEIPYDKRVSDVFIPLPIKQGPFSYLEILRLLEREPELRKLNPGIRNERFYAGLAKAEYVG